MVDSKRNNVLSLSAGPGFEGLFFIIFNPIDREKNYGDRSYIHCIRQVKRACFDPSCT